MNYPKRIIDLHTHLFNARYVPLSGIIAHAMGKEESLLAKLVAAFLEAITGSSYDTKLGQPVAFGLKERNNFLLSQIWQRTENALLQTMHSQNAVTLGVPAIATKGRDSLEFQAVLKSEIYQKIDELAREFAKAAGEAGKPMPPGVALPSLGTAETLGDVFAHAEKAVKAGVLTAAMLMQPGAIDGHDDHTEGVAATNDDGPFKLRSIGDYLEFFCTMLSSEEAQVQALLKSYGNNLPPLQVVHYMMDMRFAFAPSDPFYKFYPDQMARMEELQSQHGAQVFGFAAFDPRRPADEWEEIKLAAQKRGFIGFKFYPAMGYRASNNIDATAQAPDPAMDAMVDAFFAYCAENDIPIFTHCTPCGFQSKEKYGINAHPKYWRPALERHRNLRLCFGHAGGSHMSNIDWATKIEIESHGWLASNEGDWTAENNFARLVTELCREFPNVYCEVGYITGIFGKDGPRLFAENLARARQALAPGPYELLDKMAYGSDWHMPSIVNRTREYLHIFLGIFNDSSLGLSAYRDKFFFQNACAYMKVPY